MTRIELTTRLNALLKIGSPASSNVREIRDAVRLLLEDINADGVLDVQQPPALIDVQRIRDRGHVTLEELQSMTAQDIVLTLAPER